MVKLMKILTTAMSSNANDGAYRLVNNGKTIGRIEIDELTAMVRDGTVLDNYTYGTQIVIPYTDPSNNVTYDLPFNFGTVREFEREDGSTFTGLGLFAEYGVPACGIQYDNVEPTNTLTVRKQFGNCRYIHSSVRQWLNKSGVDWYEEQHEYDAAPTTPDPATIKCFPDCLPKEFVDSCVEVKVLSYACKHDSYSLDATYDKFFLLATSEINSRMSDGRYGLTSDAEGSYWEYWRYVSGATDYWSSTVYGSNGLNDNVYRTRYTVEDHTANCEWFLRSVRTPDAYLPITVRKRGSVSPVNASEIRRVVPACVIG